MNLEELETSWATLEAPESPDGISGRRATGMPREQPVYLAVDGRGRRHLLILVPDKTPPLNQRETRGLEVSTTRYLVGSNPEALYLDLVCVDQAQYPTFSAVAQDMLRALARPHGVTRDAIISALARWRAFWSTGTDVMSRENALALFGELWFMRRWLSPISAGTLGHWQATEDAQHDYQWPAVSVEVKTTESKPHQEPQHAISSLGQMDNPEQGQLFLFSLQVCEDTLAADCLRSLVEGIGAELRDDLQALANLDRKLAIRGYSPADRTNLRRFRILAERLYRVEDGFPRITRRTFQPSALPSGVVNVGYTVDLASCQRWLVATTPTDPAASCLHSTD